MAIAGTTHPLTYPQVLAVCRAAHRAPWPHPGHPWLFRPRTDGLDVIERGYNTRASSPAIEQARLISCGAAIRNADVALAHAGYTPVLRLLPDGPACARLATVTAGAPTAASAANRIIYRAIWTRRTYRRAYLAQSPIETPLPAGVFGIAEAAGVRLVLVPAVRRAQLAQLLCQAAQDRVSAEATGTHRRRTSSVLPAAPPLADDVRLGTMVVLLTEHDSRPAWLRTGLALQALLLSLTVNGLVAAFVDPPIEQPAHRSRLAELLGESGHPQVVLQIGVPAMRLPPTPRCPLEEVLTA